MTIPIAEIEFGERRREDYGDIAALAASIRRYGLIHPIVIDAEKHLVAGGRRVEACTVLGYLEIEARDFGDLTPEERREIELEENLRRKDLTPYEQARELVRKAPVVAEALAANLVTKTPRGEPRQMATPKEDVAQALGTSASSLVRSEQHVATADTYPFMQKPEWKQYHVLEAREALDKIPETEREVIASMASEAGTPQAEALKMVKNVAAMPDEERRKVVSAYQSADRRNQQWAQTRALDRAPYIDEREVVIGRILRDLRDCERMYPGDPFNDRFSEEAVRMKALQSEIETARKERNNATSGN